jgi:hypothetical protein
LRLRQASLFPVAPVLGAILVGYGGEGARCLYARSRLVAPLAGIAEAGLEDRLPMASNFSRPSIRYFSRQSPPAGVTSRPMPAPPASLQAFALGFAFRIATSVRAICLSVLLGITPNGYPHAWGYSPGLWQIPPNTPPASCGWI